MKATFPAETGIKTVALLFALLGAVNVYRASTQSITYDEAVTYDAFVVGPLSNAFTGYNANNHVLFSVLAKFTTATLGPSELGLRLPSVLAGGVYFVVVFLLCRHLFGRGPIFSLAALALACNPLVLDFLSAARGYGLALALFMVALYQVVVILVSSSSSGGAGWGRWVVVSLALGGAVSANLAFLFPAVGLGMAALTLTAIDTLSAGRASLWRFGRTTVLSLAGPGPVMAAALLVVPLTLAEREHFAYGASGLSGTVTSLVNLSVWHHFTGWYIDTVGEMVGSVVSTYFVPLTLATLFATVGIIGARAVRARKSSVLTAQDRALLLLAGTLTITLAQLVAVHYLWDVPYPLDRTGLYFVPMFVLVLPLLADRAGVWRRGSSVVRGCSLVFLSLLLSLFLAQFNMTQYGMWRFDAGTRTLYDIMARWPDTGRDASFRIAASWLLRPSLNHYRFVDPTSRVVSVSDGLAGVQPNQFDFAVVTDWVWGDVESSRDVASLVCTHPVSGAMLFVNRFSPVARGLDSVRRTIPPGADCEQALSALR